MGCQLRSISNTTLSDRGGTFTDVVVIYADGSEWVFKLLSKDPTNYDDAPIEALRRIVAHATGTPVPRGVPLNMSCIGLSLHSFCYSLLIHIQHLCAWEPRWQRMHYSSGKVPALPFSSRGDFE